MRPGRPKQHVHNWKLQVKDFSPFVSSNEIEGEWDLRPYSFGGFYARRYWACIRGNKIKHTRHIYTINNNTVEKQDQVFVAASGISSVLQERQW